MEVKIRQAKNNEEDFKKYRPLRNKQYIEVNEKIHGKSNFEGPAKDDASGRFNVAFNSGDKILFAEVDSKVIGYLELRIGNEPNRLEATIEDIFVIKKHRRKGIGTRLVKKGIDLVKKKSPKSKEKYLEIDYLYNQEKEAIEFFENLGFEVQAKVYGKEIK